MGGGRAAGVRWGCPSGAENSEVRSMRGSPFSYSLVIFEYGLRIRICDEPKSTSTAIPSSTPITRPRPYMSCVTWSPTAKCLGAGATGALKGLVGK